MNKEILQQYAEIKTAIKTLTDQAKDIELKVTEEMDNEAVDKVNSDFGTFFFTTRRKYKYSTELLEKEIELKELKKEEEKTAIFEEARSLSYRAPKL